MLVTAILAVFLTAREAVALPSGSPSSSRYLVGTCVTMLRLRGGKAKSPSGIHPFWSVSQEC